MSERGSFVTEYIYCEECFDALKSILNGDGKYFHCITIPGYEVTERFLYFFHRRKKVVENLPIIAGKIGGLYAGEELDTFELDLYPQIKEKICHPVRIAVLAENGSNIFTIEPNVVGENDD